MIDGLNSRTTYRMLVRGFNKAGSGANSTVVTCYTVTVPGQPGKPQLVSSSSSQITVEWQPAYDDGGSPIKFYQLEMDLVEGLGLANVRNWVVKFTGPALTYSVTTGLIAKS